MEYQGSQYDAILVRGTPRFRKNRRMVAADSVPPVVKAQLLIDINKPKDITPSPAELQATQSRPQEAGIAPIEEPPFEELLPTPAPVEAADFTEPAVIPSTANGMPSEYEMELIRQLEEAKQQLAEDGKKTLTELATAMYEQYGVYTVFVGKAPKEGDAHPFSGQTMTRYELGLAYQLFNRAQAQGLLVVDFAEQYARQQQSQKASEVHAEEINARSEGYNGGYSTFAERTSVRGQNMSSTRTVARPNDPISEDVTAEPDLRGKTVRENW